MRSVKQVRWSETRDVGALGTVCVQMVGDLSPDGWEFSEKEAFECVWYPVKFSKDLAARAIDELNKEQPIDSDARFFAVPAALIRKQSMELNRDDGDWEDMIAIPQVLSEPERGDCVHLPWFDLDERERKSASFETVLATI